MALSGVAGLYCLLPGLRQLIDAMRENPGLRGGVMPGWWADTLSFLSLGIRWRSDEPENPLLLESVTSLLFLAGIAGLALLLAAGVTTLWRSR